MINGNEQGEGIRYACVLNAFTCGIESSPPNRSVNKADESRQSSSDAK